MPSVSILPAAKEDLLGIWCYIGRDNPSAADAFLDLLESKFRLLASSPGIGRLRQTLGASIRTLPVEDYLIFYRQADSGIDVVRVLHGARDLEACFHEIE